MVFSEMFWTFFITSILACILKLSSSIYKSKCSHIKCCGFDVERNVQLEEREHEYDIEHNVYKSENEK